MFLPTTFQRIGIRANSEKTLSKLAPLTHIHRFWHVSGFVSHPLSPGDYLCPSGVLLATPRAGFVCELFTGWHYSYQVSVGYSKTG